MLVAHGRGFRNFGEARRPISGKLPVTQLTLFTPVAEGLRLRLKGLCAVDKRPFTSEEPVLRPLVARNILACSLRLWHIARKTDESRGSMRIKLASIVVDNQDPSPAGPVTIAVCSDTCGNLIQLY